MKEQFDCWLILRMFFPKEWSFIVSRGIYSVYNKSRASSLYLAYFLVMIIGKQPQQWCWIKFGIIKIELKMNFRPIKYVN